MSVSYVFYSKLHIALHDHMMAFFRLENHKLKCFHVEYFRDEEDENLTPIVEE